MMVESAGETPENAQNVEAALVDEDEPEILVLEYSDVDDSDDAPQVAVQEVGRDDAWITVDKTSVVDLAEAQ